MISVIYGCITNHPKLEWLKTRFIFIGLHFAFKEFGQGSMGIAYLCSHVLIARFKLHLAGGYTMAIGLKWLHSHVWDYGAGCWLSCPVFFFFSHCLSLVMVSYSLGSLCLGGEPELLYMAAQGRKRARVEAARLRTGTVVLPPHSTGPNKSPGHL